METVFFDYLTRLVGDFVDPSKRVFLGYLAAAAAIAAAVTLIAARRTPDGGRGALRERLFSRRIWWSRSARADYGLYAVNRAVMMGVVPRLVGQLAVATALFEACHAVFGVPPGWGRALPAWAVVAAFTLGQFLLDDLSRYLVHRALHRWPLLWAFHKVHHSAETLTPLTVFRTHPVEGVLFALRSAAAHGTAIALFVFLFGEAVDLATVLGANIFLFAFNAAGSNLRHSHVPIGYGATLERILISPAQHQIHHSVAPEHHDRNFGSVLAIWDRIGGTLALSEPGRALRFGLDENANAAAGTHRLATLYFGPLAEAGRTLRHSGRRMRNAFAGPTGPASAGPDALTEDTGARRMKRLRTLTGLGLALAGAAGLFAAAGADRAAAESGTLDIYSHRQPFLIEPFIEAYKEETGVEVNIVYASRGLAQRLMAEGERSPADVVLTVDIGRLWIYADQDLLAPIESETLTANVPAHLRAPDNTWFALSKRARVIAVSKDRIEEGAIQRYEDLADDRWAERICTRPGSHVYNRALMASLIAAYGEEKAEAWAADFVDNLARRPQGNDRAQLKAIYQGECDIAIVNHYYWAKLKHGDKPAQQKWADSVRIVFPNQDGRGTHINISGGGVAKYSDNKQGAADFLAFLSEKKAQQLYGRVNFEYPVNPAVGPPEKLKALGDFKEDDLPIVRIAELAPTAQRVIDRVGW